MRTVVLYVLSLIAAGLIGKFSDDLYDVGKRLITGKARGRFIVRLSESDPKILGGVYHGPVPDSEEVEYTLNYINTTTHNVHIQQIDIKPAEDLKPFGYIVNTAPIDIATGTTADQTFKVRLSLTDMCRENNYLPILVQKYNELLNGMRKQIDFVAHVKYLENGQHKNLEVNISVAPVVGLASSYSQRLKELQYNNNELDDPVRKGITIAQDLIDHEN